MIDWLADTAQSVELYLGFAAEAERNGDRARAIRYRTFAGRIAERARIRSVSSMADWTTPRVEPLNRTAEQWQKCDPKAMAKMSEPAIMYALADARRDVLRMHAEIERLRDAIRKTLDENKHLADGDVCTLGALKHALSERPYDYPSSPKIDRVKRVKDAALQIVAYQTTGQPDYPDWDRLFDELAEALGEDYE